MTGWKDHQLMKAIIEDDWTFVTRNSDDFRPRTGSLSQAPFYVGQPLHAGLVCLNLPEDSIREEQIAYFQEALKDLGTPGDLVNQVLEVDPDFSKPNRVTLKTYDFPQVDP